MDKKDVIMQEIKKPIPSRIYNASKDGYVAGADDIIDDALNKKQSTVNRERMMEVAGIEDRLEVVEELAAISIEGGEIQIGFANDLENPTAEQKAKVATIGAVYDTILGTKVIVEATEIEIEPNKFYNFRNTITSSVKIYLLPPTDANKENEYKIQFTAGEGAVVEFLNGAIDAQGVRTPILWLNDDPLRAYANTTYQVSVLNNLAVYTGWELPVVSGNNNTEEINTEEL